MVLFRMDVTITLDICSLVYVEKVHVDSHWHTIHIEQFIIDHKYLWAMLRRETSYGLGCTTTDWMKPEINPFQYERDIKTSNTKG